jgi:hypothetical protein
MVEARRVIPKDTEGKRASKKKQQRRSSNYNKKKKESCWKENWFSRREKTRERERVEIRST